MTEELEILYNTLQKTEKSLSVIEFYGLKDWEEVCSFIFDPLKSTSGVHPDVEQVLNEIEICRLSLYKLKRVLNKSGLEEPSPEIINGVLCFMEDEVRIEKGAYVIKREGAIHDSCYLVKGSEVLEYFSRKHKFYNL